MGADVNIRRFIRNERGATAIEFALLVGPFLLVVLASIEIGIKAFIQADLDRMLTELTSDLSMTFNDAEDAADYITTTACDRASLLLDCNELDVGATVVDGRLFDYRNASLSGTWDVGCPGDTVIIELTYGYFDVLFPFAIADIVQVDGAKRYRSRAVLRREPILAGNDNCAA